MEILPVTPEHAEELSQASLEDFSAIAIKQYEFPTSADNTYRVFTADGTIIDVQADNASLAYQLANRNDVVKISRIEFSHNEILSQDAVAFTGQEVTSAISSKEEVPLMAEFASSSEAPEFNTMDLHQFATSYQSS